MWIADSLDKNAGLRRVEIERWQHRVRRRPDTKVVLQEKHVRDLTNMDGIVLRQIDGVVGGTELRAPELDRVRGLQKWKDRNTAARCFSRAK